MQGIQASAIYLNTQATETYSPHNIHFSTTVCSFIITFTLKEEKFTTFYEWV